MVNAMRNGSSLTMRLSAVWCRQCQCSSLAMFILFPQLHYVEIGRHENTILFYHIIFSVNTCCTVAARNLVCFSQSKGDETKNCDQSRGFKTCFTRYNSGILQKIHRIKQFSSAYNVSIVNTCLLHNNCWRAEKFPQKAVPTSLANFMTCLRHL